MASLHFSPSGFLKARRGSVSVIFALSSVALVALIGVAVDYGAALKNRARLSAAVDSATLAVSAAIVNDPTPTTAKYRVIAQQSLESNLLGASFDLRDFHICDKAMNDCAVSNGQTLESGQVYIAAASQSPRYLTQIIPVDTGGSRVTMPIGASSVSAKGDKPFIDIYVLVDVSASMGLGASPSDQSGMRAQMGCEFACHNMDSKVASTPFNDSVLWAHQQGYKLRIDAVREALLGVLSNAQAANAAGATIRFGIYTFANKFTTVHPISANYGGAGDTGASTIYGAVNSLDIAALYNGTNIPYALKQMQSIIPASGDGKTAASPKTFLFLASDGTANATIVDSDGAAWYVDPNWRGILPDAFVDGVWNAQGGAAINGGVACPGYQTLTDAIYEPNPRALFENLPVPCVPQPYWPGYWENSIPGKLSYPTQDQQFIQPIDPNWCAPIKTKGANVMTLYTTYVGPQPPEQAYVNYVTYAVVPKIQNKMQECASAATFAHVASDAAGINASLKSMFNKAVGPVRLTR